MRRSALCQALASARQAPASLAPPPGTSSTPVHMHLTPLQTSTFAIASVGAGKTGSKAKAAALHVVISACSSLGEVSRIPGRELRVC